MLFSIDYKTVSCNYQPQISETGVGFDIYCGVYEPVI